MFRCKGFIRLKVKVFKLGVVAYHESETHPNHDCNSFLSQRVLHGRGERNGLKQDCPTGIYA